LATPLRNAVVKSAWGRGKKDIPPGIARKLQDTTVITSTALVEPRFRRDFARTMRVEPVSDRVKGQKFKVKDERPGRGAPQALNAPPAETFRNDRADRGNGRGDRGNDRTDRGGGPPARDIPRAAAPNNRPQNDRGNAPQAERAARPVAPQAERVARPAKPERSAKPERPARPAPKVERPSRPVQPQGSRVSQPVEQPRPQQQRPQAQPRPQQQPRPQAAPKARVMRTEPGPSRSPKQAPAMRSEPARSQPAPRQAQPKQQQQKQQAPAKPAPGGGKGKGKKP